MNDIHIQPVKTARQRRIFLSFPWRIYKDDPLWVPPLLRERARVINPRRGEFFQRGDAEFFIAWRGNQPVGTICAAEDRITNQQRGLSDCIFGFFECIDDYEVAQALWKQSIRWAKKRNLNALYGPFNLDYEDSYGILIEGRDRPPTLLCGHTPPYYQDFVERFGFQPARGDNLAFKIDLDLNTPASQRLMRLADRLRQRTDFKIRSADLAHWDDEIERIFVLLNQALTHLPDFIPWQKSALEASLSVFRSLADPELVLFAEAGDRTVGWFPGIANLNEALIHANGLRRPWDYLKLWWHARRQPACLAIKSVLVLPEYWDTGISVLLFDEMLRRAVAKGYQWVDLSLTSDDNPRTPILARHYGARVYKRYRVYRYPIPDTNHEQSLP